MLLTGVIQDSGKLPRHSRRHRDCSKQHTSRDSIIHRNEFIVTSPKLLQRSHSRWFWTFATIPVAEVDSERRSARSYTRLSYQESSVALSQSRAISRDLVCRARQTRSREIDSAPRAITATTTECTSERSVARSPPQPPGSSRKSKTIENASRDGTGLSTLSEHKTPQMAR